MFDLERLETQHASIPEPAYERDEMARVISAAVVSPRFRQQLLNNPVSAIRAGYQGERFHLKSEEMQWVQSVQAKDLPDFAAQLLSFRTTAPRQFSIPLETPAAVMVRAH